MSEVTRSPRLATNAAEAVDGIAWVPDEVTLGRSRLQRLIDRTGAGTYVALLERIAEDPEWYWREALADLENLGDERIRSLVERAAALGELELACAALEKTHAEAVLERHHVARQRGFRPSARAARPAEAAGGGDEVEVGQQTEIDSRVIHFWNDLSIRCALRAE